MLKDCTLIEPLHCHQDEGVVEVAKKLREHLIRYIFVTDDDVKPVGVISTTDVNNRVVAEGKDPTRIKARDIMTTPVQAYEESEDEREAYTSCVRNQISTCAVTREGKLIGMVTVHELLRQVTHVE